MASITLCTAKNLEAGSAARLPLQDAAAQSAKAQAIAPTDRITF